MPDTENTQFMLDSVIGGGQAASALKTALSAKSLPHAVLLAAPDGCGRNFAARCLMADYLFPAAGESHPGVQAVLADESPEVLLVQGEGKSGQIPVDRIREVRNSIFHSALSAAGRAVHIRNAHNMAAPAANALLKVLEEPPADVLFVLTAQSPGALPATILSRCAVYTLPPVGEEGEGRVLCENMLKAALPEGESESLVTSLCTLYGGRAGLGLAALKNPERLATARDALAAVKAAAARNTYALLCIFAKYEGRADGDREKRAALLSDITDALDAALRGTAKNGLTPVPPQAAALLLPPVADARAALNGNAAPKITFAALAAQLSRAGL